MDPPVTIMDISSRLENIHRRVETAAARAGRSPKSVRLVAVTKYRTVAQIEEAIRAGATDIGENRVQEAEQKLGSLGGRDIVWHLIGHLQSNKTKRAVPMFDWIHSLDSIGMARRLNRLAEEQDKMQRVLVQVDLSGEETKSGLPAAEFFEALDEMNRLENLSVEGLMVLPPYLPDPEETRPYFARLRELGDAARARGCAKGPLEELSMGMSHDFDVAIEEGATMIRVGTALFGERPSSQPNLDAGL
jgi:pyridoxal phosphate enzyme (YggS family)